MEKVGTGSTKTALDFITDEQDIMFPAKRFYLLQVVFWRSYHTFMEVLVCE